LIERKTGDRAADIDLAAGITQPIGKIDAVGAAFAAKGPAIAGVGKASACACPAATQSPASVAPISAILRGRDFMVCPSLSVVRSGNKARLSRSTFVKAS